jgi:hypothetical protein
MNRKNAEVIKNGKVGQQIHKKQKEKKKLVYDECKKVKKKENR